MFRLIVASALIAACAGIACAQEAPEQPAQLIPHWWARQAVFTVPPARPQAPTIDGNVGYQEWYYASSISGFIDSDTGNLSELPVQMYVCYDAEHVYVGVIIHRPPMHPTPRTTFEAGRHEHIWWQDDGFELVIRPGRPEAGVEHYYAFVGNAAGAWSLMRGELEGAGGDSSWPADWQYAAGPLGRESWSAELAIPVAQLTAAEAPAPGAVWFMDLMSQQVTPAKRIIDLGLVWNLGMHGYRSPVTPRFVFVGEDGPILRPHGVGRLSQTEAQELQHTGMRMVFYNLGDEPFTLNGQVQLFRAPADRPEGALSLYDAWDRVGRIRETGQPDTDPTQGVQAFRSEEDILRELNERYEFVAGREGRFTVEPDPDPEQPGAGFFNLEEPIANGEYIVAWRFTDADSGEVVSAQVVPYAVLPALKVSLRPFFLKYEKLRAEASLANLELFEGDSVRFVLSVAGQEVASAATPVMPGADSVHAYLDSSGIAPKAAATVVATLVRADGTEVISSSATIVRPPNPEWWPNEIGRSPVVPPPFEPVRADGEHAFTLWQRRVEIGEDGLPRSIVARGTELLARPVTLDLGGPAQWICRRVLVDERDAIFEANGSLGPVTLAMRTHFHYDGTGRFDLQVTPPPGGATLERLVLDIPVTEEFARLAFHLGIWTDPQRSQADGFAGDLEEWFARYPDGFLPFTFTCYLGAEDRGLQWFCEADRDWSDADEERVVGLVREDGAVVLRITMIDEPLQVTEPWRVTFGLTVTPVKDPRPGRQIVQVAMGRPPEIEDRSPEEDDAFLNAIIAAGANTVSTYITDDEHFGEPSIVNPRYEAAAHAWAEKLHALGLRYMPYTGWGVNANIPDFATFGQEMLAEPVKNIGWGCFLHNHASTFPDWWLWGAKHTIEVTGLDGMYMDGMAMPRLQFNELDGFAWTDRKGRARGTWCIWAIRDFIERLYVYTHVEAPKPATIRNHCNLETYCIGAFTDERVTGEGQYHAGDTLLGVNSLAQFRANFMTHPNGVATTGLWWNWLNLPITRNEMRAMFLLHDVPMVVGGGIVRYYGHQIGYGRDTRPWVHLHKLRMAFEGAQFVGYWQAQLVRCAPAGPIASAWVDRERGRALVVIANLPNERWSGTVSFDRAALGIAADARPVDAMFDEPLTTDGDTLSLQIEPQRYRLIIFGERVPVPENARID
ncbi:MAG: hypothetical protein AB7Y46_08005 [Armatimonadota bacterium]